MTLDIDKRFPGGLVEVVPNVSEGRDRAAIDAIANAAAHTTGAILLDVSSDADHNRTVLTIVAPPDAAVEAAYNVVIAAATYIDIRKHTGIHPWVGAADVVPFVPLGRASMETCVDLARRLGARVGEALAIPVYLYEAAATRTERRVLANIRRGGLRQLARLMSDDPAFEPDFGPSAPHPHAGAMVTGARPFLIAFNIHLDGGTIREARAIARAVRESSGGLPAVRALGLSLAQAGVTQVSMNLTDFRVTSVYAAFDAVTGAAARLGLAVKDSELIGLIPEAALEGDDPARLVIRDFSPDRILENRLARVLGINRHRGSEE
ncbi:glutamate formimidoyltransferase [bacterium]|nr:glutamate formimidoyltransferase [bacterium]